MTKVFAYSKDSVVEALIMGYYRFDSGEQARKQLQIIKDKYFVSRHALHADTPDSCVIWIKGYALLDEEKEQGKLGNFARVTCCERTKAWGFKVEKITDDAPHPQRKRTEQRHPNWGHPILRGVDMKEVHKTLESARNALAKLQQEYPHVSVPGKECLFIAIYGREPDAKAKRVTRYVLEIEARVEGGYVIEAKVKKPKAKTKTLPAPPKEPGEPVGYFSAKVALKREKKKK